MGGGGEVKERPILFNGEMVRAILDGCKVQTRRVIKPQPPAWARFENPTGDGVTWTDRNEDTDDLQFWPDYDKPIICPYGVPGDRLWVRETFETDPSEGDITYLADGEVYRFLCKASDVFFDRHRKGKRFPSIHMPRWASRITLEIVSVCVERVRDISEEDAKAEGIQLLDAGWGIEGIATRCQCPTVAFANLWDLINESRGFGWDANPWVWVVSFKRIESQREGR